MPLSQPEGRLPWVHAIVSTTYLTKNALWKDLRKGVKEDFEGMDQFIDLSFVALGSSV